MSHISHTCVVFSAALVLGFLPAKLSAIGFSWQSLEDGLEFAEWDMPYAAKVGDSKIRILRASPVTHRLTLHMVSAGDSDKPLSAMDWASTKGLSAATNAGMYQKDGSKSVGYMKRDNHTNNPRVSRDKSILVAASDGSFQLIDRECDDWEKIQKRFSIFIQSIRMISCRGTNVWSQQDKIWSQVAVGLDADNRILFAHARAPYSTHDFSKSLLALPLNLKRAMYLEGGPPAQMAVRTKKLQQSFIGSYSTGSNENDANAFAVPVPNVIGLEQKKK